MMLRITAFESHSLELIKFTEQQNFAIKNPNRPLRGWYMLLFYDMLLLTIWMSALNSKIGLYIIQSFIQLPFK